MLGNGDSMGETMSNSVTGVPDPIGRKLGEPHPWRLFSVIW